MTKANEMRALTVEEVDLVAGGSLLNINIAIGVLPVTAVNIGLGGAIVKQYLNVGQTVKA